MKKLFQARLTALLIALSASTAFSSDLPKCPSDQSKSYDDCFGTYTWPDGRKYVGEWKDDEENGYGAETFADGSKFFGKSSEGERTAGLYVDISGAARFNKNWAEDGYLNYNAHNVLPVLKQTFNSLDIDERQAIQYILKEEGMYNSSIDGLWGRQTLNAIAEFAVLRLKTIELNLWDVTEQIIVEIAKTGLGETDDNSIITDQNPRAASSSDRPKCPANQLSYYSNCFGTRTYSSGDKYVGQWSDGIQKGRGTYTFGPKSERAGDVYWGEFKDALFHGKGTYTFADGSKYVCVEWHHPCHSQWSTLAGRSA